MSKKALSTQYSHIQTTQIEKKFFIIDKDLRIYISAHRWIAF